MPQQRLALWSAHHLCHAPRVCAINHACLTRLSETDAADQHVFRLVSAQYLEMSTFVSFEAYTIVFVDNITE